MQITLGNFRKWRIKRFLTFLFCMGISIAIAFFVNKIELNTGILLTGLIAYDMIKKLPMISKNSYEAYISEKSNIINVKTSKKEYFIKKSDIKEVFLKEINYGGKYLDVIGYRLSVIADKKYIFDSERFGKDKRQKEDEMKKLLKLFQS